jgi:hypothetical protein
LLDNRVDPNPVFVFSSSLCTVASCCNSSADKSISSVSEEDYGSLRRGNSAGQAEEWWRLACDEVSVDAYFVSFGVNGDVGSAGIVDEIFFPDIAAVFNGNGGFLQPKLFVETSGKSRFRKECDACSGWGTAKSAEHRPIENRLGSGNRGASSPASELCDPKELCQEFRC